MPKQRYAIFFDATPFFVNASVALFRYKAPKASLEIDVENVVSWLETHAKAVFPDGELLRIYWYDGGVRVPSSFQLEVSLQKNVKYVCSPDSAAGEHRNLDPLICLDMLDVAQNCSISDILVVTNNSSLAFGIEAAQRRGVRCQALILKGLDRPGEESVSKDLLSTVDSFVYADLQSEGVQWLKQKPASLEDPESCSEPTPSTQGSPVEDAARLIFSKLTEEEKESVRNGSSQNIPYAVDRRLMGALHHELLKNKRTMSDGESKQVRQKLFELATKAS